MKKKTTVLMLVSNDKYELPMGVYRSFREMARKLAIPIGTLLSAYKEQSVLRYLNARIERVTYYED